MNQPQNFKEKYQTLFKLITEADIITAICIPDMERIDNSLVINFFNRKIIVNRNAVSDKDNEPLTDAVKTVICHYLIMYRDALPESSNKLVTLRELSNASPLFLNIVSNTGKIIETTFSRQSEKLKSQCLKIHGTEILNTSFDLSFRFNALGSIPIILNFNDQDEMFPAAASYLFQENAGNYLDIESLTVLCTYLTGQLIK